MAKMHHQLPHWDSGRDLKQAFEKKVKKEHKKLEQIFKEVVSSLSELSLPKSIQQSLRLAQRNHSLVSETALSWYWSQSWSTYLDLLDDLLTLQEESDREDLLEEISEKLFDYFSQGAWAKEFLRTKNFSLARGCWKVLGLEIAQLNAVITRQLSLSSKQAQMRPLLEIGETIRGNNIQLSPSFVLGVESKFHLKVYAIPKREQKMQKQRLEHALECLQQWAPESYERLTFFTHSLIGIKDAGLVSFSSQDLPGYSSINLWHRDDIDLLDDLIHENGHHHLNALLNLTELIIEDDDAIFYSPWRKAPRPIRGIYHGFFTFYWAFDLFRQLIQNSTDSPLKKKVWSSKELTKMRYRCLDEYFQLTACLQSLQAAYQMKKVTTTGMALVEDLKNCLMSYEAWISSILSELPKNLQKRLTEKRKFYLKMEQTTIDQF